MSISNAPPRYRTEIFNSSLFNSSNYITQEEADLRYLPLSAGVNLGLISGITPGIASASKALIFDSNRDITNINIATSNKYITNNLDINNNGDINLYGTANNIHLHSTIAASISLFGTISNTITFQGSTGFLLMSGNTQYIALDGSSNFIRIVNTTASTSSSTGGIRCSGGAYFGNDSIFNTQISIGGSILNSTNAGYLTSISAGTASALKCLVLDVNRDITNIRNFGCENLNTTTLGLTTLNLTGILTSSNITDSTSLTSGSIILAGGIGISKQLSVRNILTTSTSINTLSLESSNSTSLSNSSLLSDYDMYIKRNDTTDGLKACGIGFSITTSNSNITMPMCSIFAERFNDPEIGNLLFSTSQNERMRISYNGNISMSNNLSVSGSLTLATVLLTATFTELNYNDISTIGEAQASKTVVLDSNKDISNIRRVHCSNLSIATKEFSNTDRLICAIDNTISNGSARYLLLGKELGTFQTAEWGFYYTSANNSLNRQEFGFFGANGIMAIVANRRVGINITTPSVDFEVNGQIKLNSTFTNTLATEATSISTGSSLFSGGIGCSKTVFCNNLSTVSTANINSYTQSTSSSTGTLNIRSVGYGLNLSYNSQFYTRMTTDASGKLAIELNTNSGISAFSTSYFKYISSTTTSLGLGTEPGSFNLHLGGYANDYSICLYNDSNLNPTYGIGANNSAILYNSGGSNGHKWYCNTTSGVGSNINKGTNIMNLSQNGDLNAIGNIISNQGIRVKNSDSTGLTGSMTNLIHDTTFDLGKLFSYNYTTAIYKNLYLGNQRLNINESTGCVGIGTTNPTLGGLEITHSVSNSMTGYGYLALSGAGTSGGSTGSVNVSLYCTNRIFATEIDCSSDKRLKENIKELDLQKCYRFMDIKPVCYNWKTNDKLDVHNGFIAQDILKNGEFINMVSLHENNAIDDKVSLEDEKYNPVGYRLALQYNEILPIHHCIINDLIKKNQMMDKKIKDNEIEINKLNKEIKEIKEEYIIDNNDLVEHVEQLYKLIEELNKIKK